MDNAQTNYEIIKGNLADIYELFVPSTINTGAQVSADRITDESLRGEWFSTANVSLATKRKGKLLLGIGGNEAFNAVFGTNTQQVCRELIDTGYVHLTPAQKDLILMLEKSGEVVFVDPSDLHLEGQSAEYRNFPIRTASYQKDVTVARMPFVSAGYGSGYMLGQVMDNLRINGNIAETLVFTISPDHAAENVKDDEIVAQASWLNDFSRYSGFLAGGHDIGYNHRLRGVRRVEAAEASRQGSHERSDLSDGAQKFGTLETLIGKGTDVGNGLVVVRKDQITEAGYALLTGKR